MARCRVAFHAAIVAFAFHVLFPWIFITFRLTCKHLLIQLRDGEIAVIGAALVHSVIRINVILDLGRSARD